MPCIGCKDGTRDAMLKRSNWGSKETSECLVRPKKTIGCTYELNTPPKNSALEVLFIRQGAALKDRDSVDDRQTTVELATWDIVVEVLSSHTISPGYSTFRVPACRIVLLQRHKRKYRTLLYHAIASAGKPCVLKKSTSSSRMTVYTCSNLARFSAFDIVQLDCDVAVKMGGGKRRRVKREVAENKLSRMCTDLYTEHRATLNLRFDRRANPHIAICTSAPEPAS